METIGVEYQLGLYYGVFFEFKYLKIIEDILKSEAKWAGLVSDKESVNVNQQLILFGVNSDKNTENRTCMIFADVLTLQGECSDAANTYLNINLTNIIKKEQNNTLAISVINSLHTLLIKALYKIKLTIPLYCGWRVVSCIWLEDVIIEPINKTISMSPKHKVLKNIKSKIMHSPRANLSASSEILK